MKILITGGAGYIGSHVTIELLNAGHDVIVLDNLCNSSSIVLDRIEMITGIRVPFYKLDIRDRKGLITLLEAQPADACIHCAGLKAVGESVLLPWEYYDNNINGTLVLLDVLRNSGCKNLIFSSSATVYGNPSMVPITENAPKGVCTNPYGWTKWMIEQILSDLYNADRSWNMVFLRYFNPVGAHPSGMIGENPKGIPNNLMPYITQVAVGKLDKVHIYGDDYDTPDGTGVRDYIHVVDLAKGHVAALKAIEKDCGISLYNLGTGTGYSVYEVIRAFEEVNRVHIPYIIDSRRPGDIAACYSSPQKAYNELGWKAEYDIRDMVRDAWNWQKNNPDGYI